MFWTKVVNIALMPLLVALIGLVVCVLQPQTASSA